MKQVNLVGPHARAHYGLPELATKEDLSRALEAAGEPTGLYHVEAPKMFGVPYLAVTMQMRKPPVSEGHRGV